MPGPQLHGGDSKTNAMVAHAKNQHFLTFHYASQSHTQSVLDRRLNFTHSLTFYQLNALGPSTSILLQSCDQLHESGWLLEILSGPGSRRARSC